MDKYLLLVVVLIGLFYYFYNKSSSVKEPTQKEIQNLEYVKEIEEKKIIETTDQIYPQISHGFKKLSKEIIKPLNTMKDLLPSNDPYMDIVRDKSYNMNKTRVYVPDFYRKDRLSGNTIETEEYRPFIYNDEEPDNSWTDINVSSHPKYYTSDIKDELTNSGSFYDKNNQYNDKTSPNTDVLTSDSCYIDKFGNSFCEDNTRLQIIPPSLITDPRNCKILDSIGSYKV